MKLGAQVIIFSQSNRMPHRQNVEGAAELQMLGLRGEPQAELHQVGQAFVALALKVVFRHPQRMVPELIHGLRHIAHGCKDFAQALAGIATVIGWGPIETDIVEIDLSDIKNMEAFDHVGRLLT
jgi:hypothetical protein